MGWGNESLFVGSGSYGKIYGKNPSIIFFSRTKGPKTSGFALGFFFFRQFDFFGDNFFLNLGHL